MHIKSYFEDLIYERRRSTVFGALLYVLSLLYRLIIGLRQIFYTCGLFKSKKVGCTVISVGNITLGGTGKTPMVIALADLLFRKQRKPAVISRGYGRKDGSEALVVSDGRSVLADSEAGGDEPVLIGVRLPGVPVVVGKNRSAASRYALDRFDVDVVVLDDGFQHRKLKRDLDIVLVDASYPFGNGKLFPAGILREPVESLGRAGAVILTRADSPEAVIRLRERINHLTSARIFTSKQRSLDLIDRHTGDVKPLSTLEGARVLAFSGIARPQSFTALLRSLGADVVAERAYPDHHAYCLADLQDILQRARDERAGMIVTTEKDAVRLAGFKIGGIWALRIEFDIVEKQEWETFLLNSL